MDGRERVFPIRDFQPKPLNGWPASIAGSIAATRPAPECLPHGLRTAQMRRLAEGSATVKEIAAILDTRRCMRSSATLPAPTKNFCPGEPRRD
jgi:hypothetical protein